MALWSAVTSLFKPVTDLASSYITAKASEKQAKIALQISQTQANIEAQKIEVQKSLIAKEEALELAKIEATKTTGQVFKEMSEKGLFFPAEGGIKEERLPQLSQLPQGEIVSKGMTYIAVGIGIIMLVYFMLIIMRR